MALQGATVPLLPRWRLVGLPFGAMHGLRRGRGADVAGTRPYLPGDDMRAIHWAASARLSSARGTDEFIVRERYAEEAPFVIVVCDRRSEMALYPDELPWLRKHEAVRAACEVIGDSAGAARGFLGYLDYATGGEDPFWRPPQSQSEAWHIRERHLAFPDFRAPEDNVARALDFLARHRRSAPPGTFVFLLSDFLSPPPRDAWVRALEHRWDVVPVVIQDSVWEQSFPALDSLVLPLARGDGRLRAVRLRPGEADERRRGNESRRAALLEELRGLAIEPILVSSHDRDAVFRAFLAWADERQFRRGRGW
jgi:uncharacterized protein (DUF58 family)